jgi:homoserine kinase
MQQVTVRVPASTSNLGPGFDCLGVALRIYNSVTVTRAPVSEQPHPPIVLQAARRFFKQVGRRAFPFSFSIVERIPRSRGLGGSATIRVGILYALNQLSGDPLDQMAIFQLCADLEGHPDNAAPASFGGFTVVSGSRPRAVSAFQRFEVSRRILPSKISRLAAVENCGNACAITAAFASKDYGKLRGMFADHLHQPFRAKLIPFLPAAIADAEKAGALGAFLSGSGSTICAITLHQPDRVAGAMKRAAKSSLSHTIITRADNRGAQVIRSQIT